MMKLCKLPNYYHFSFKFIYLYYKFSFRLKKLSGLDTALRLEFGHRCVSPSIRSAVVTAAWFWIVETLFVLHYGSQKLFTEYVLGEQLYTGSFGRPGVEEGNCQCWPRCDCQ